VHNPSSPNTGLRRVSTVGFESPLLELLDGTDWMQDPTSQINRFIQIDFVDE
jgi:hypothetical protein